MELPASTLRRWRLARQHDHGAVSGWWDHSELAGLMKEQFMNEVDRTRQAILQAVGELFTLDKDVRYLRHLTARPMPTPASMQPN
jgi:hypothetical protein